MLSTKQDTPVEACPEVGGGTDTYKLHLAYYDKSIEVPPVPTDLSLYAYASENALVAIPVSCVAQFSSNFTTQVTLNDRQPGGPTGMAYLRVSELTGGFDTLKQMTGCARGLALTLHGTGGPGWDTVAYAAMMAGMGYLVVLPDSQAMPDSMGLKGKRPLKAAADISTSNYCGSFGAYSGKCYGFNKPMCYSSKAQNMVNNTVGYQKYMERIFTIRKFELDHFVQEHMDFVDLFQKVFLLGNSEGGMVSAKYHHATLDAKLTGRIISSYACDFNYFSGCHTKVCGDQCDKDKPTLNVIGTHDNYFSTLKTSMSMKVASQAGGFGGPITGNCKAAFETQGFTKATTVEFVDGSHGPMYTHENELRSVLADFLEQTADAASMWASLKTCSLADGVYQCKRVGDQYCNLTSWKKSTVDVPWDFTGAKPFDSYPVR